MYDLLVIGAGLFGSVIANEAKRKNLSVAVLDKRTHVGGNCHTSDMGGIHVHDYGPHIFHTSDERIWQYVKQFAKFNNFTYRPKVRFRSNTFSFPINLMTLHQVWGVNSPQEAEEKLSRVRIPCDNPRNLEEWILAQIGRELYEIFIYGYTKKQWMKDPKDLPASIVKRIPIRLTYDDNYFNDTYQGIPVGGYTQIFNGLLDGCDIFLGEDYFSKKDYWESKAKKIVYTGRIDEYFSYCHGRLEYRTLQFENFKGGGDHQGNAVINYTEENIPHTRITEHKHFQTENTSKITHTIWTKETPVEWQETSVPYYPIGDTTNLQVYEKYKIMTSKTPNVLFGGRLSEYKYYDMHQVIGSALAKSQKFLI